MRVVIVGATGNAGTALLRRLRAEPDVEIGGVARRLPDPVGVYRDVDWHATDVAEPAGLTDFFRGADAVVNLAWQIQPSHDQRRLYRTNVLGAREVLRAALDAKVGTLVQASSVGVYSPGPKDALVDENYPRRGVLPSSYSRHKALVERMLDQVDGLRVVRVRPGLIFQRDAGSEIARYFAGPLLPTRLLRRRRIPVVPVHRRLRLQAVHADDVADAYARILRSDAGGAFNLAAAPVLDGWLAGQVFHGVPLKVPAAALAGAAALSWRARLQPVDPGWIHLALAAPLMSSQRAERELGWRPRHDAVAALKELVAGIADHAGLESSPPLFPDPKPAGRLPGTGDPY